jgi:hypothetical protein
MRSSTSNWTRFPSHGERPLSSLGCIILEVKYSSVCGCRYSCSDGRQRLQSEVSTHGSRSESCSVMAAALMLMRTRSSEGYSEHRPTTGSLSLAARDSAMSALNRSQPSFNPRHCLIPHRLALSPRSLYMRAHSTHGLWCLPGRNPAETSGGVRGQSPEMPVSVEANRKRT